MRNFGKSLRFPLQRVSGKQKQKADWYANCIDFVIDSGINCNNRKDTNLKLNILHGNIPEEYYKKTLNPYNSDEEKYKRFPATMRNLDIMKDIVRRYVSEYHKGIHEFVVGADNPDLILNKEAKLKEEIGKLAMQAFEEEFQKRMQEATQQAQQTGQNPDSINPQDVMPDVEQFVNDFNAKYLDDESKQAQNVLNFVKSNTEDTFIYLSAFFDYCSLGECYTYTDVRGDKIVKEHIPLLEAYPIPNSNFFVEDHDMFARRMLLSYQQISDMFYDVLTEKDRKFLEDCYGNNTPSGPLASLSYTQYFESYPEYCDKFQADERDLFKKQPVRISETNSDLIEVWHVVWRGEAKRGILTYADETGVVATKVVDEYYEFNEENGDIAIEYEYEPQVYEGYRIGHRYDAIYPIKARPVAYNRNGKLPYNGIMEVLPYMGKFSIVECITPYQILRNIISYHREMVIAKNKLMILIMPESLVASNTEDRIHKMAADGVLYFDDSEDTNSLKAQQIRLLNANMGDYIRQLSELMESIKLEAREMVDMNMQRYGDIAQSAGVGTTQEAISRSSMGMVILVQMFDEFRKRDYNRDLDYCKLAYVDGLDTTYWDELGKKQYLSLDVNSFVNSDYSTMVKNETKEIDKINELKQWAFSAAQNGDLDMAIAAITGDNVSQIKASVMQFQEIKRQHETEMQQMEQQLEQQKLQTELAKIQEKGNQDRLTEQLKQQYALQLKYVDVDVSMLGAQPQPDNSAETALKEQIEQTKANIERQKLALEAQKVKVDLYNAAADRQVKREEMQNDLKIAKTNKNKYDK